MIEAYPLSWPLGYKRTPAGKKKHAKFQTSFAVARDGVIKELKMMGAKNIIISTNVPLKRDGLPYAVPYGKTNVTDDTGIAVYFDYNGETRVLACDTWLTLDDNMQAIAKTVEALRGIERWQVSEMLNRTFTGFKAIPEQVESQTSAWWGVLEVPQSATADQIKEAYRKKVMECHPDKGGSVEAFNRVQSAYRQATSMTK